MHGLPGDVGQLEIWGNRDSNCCMSAARAYDAACAAGVPDTLKSGSAGFVAVSPPKVLRTIQQRLDGSIGLIHCEVL